MITYCVRRCLLCMRNLLATTSPSWRPAPGASFNSRPSAGKYSFHTALEVSEGYHLDGRGVVRINGRDTVDVLQGLVTSDVTGLTDISQGCGVQYSMMLNVQGRVLFDLIIYNHSKVLDDVCFLVECDSSVKEEFIKTVKRYRIRKKMDLCDVSDQYKVWHIPSNLDPSKPLTVQEEEGKDEERENTQEVKVPQAIFCVPDPRVPQFGQRAIFRNGEETLVNMHKDSEQYSSLRYRWGIPEGTTDLPPGNCLPLESNLTIMNGVSFLKGCYIGQELTARSHHTGVIRKRLVPVVFESSPPSVEQDTQIITDTGKNAGKLRGAVGKNGLGLLRLQHCEQPLFLSTLDGQKLPLSCYRPGWWPKELQKHS